MEAGCFLHAAKAWRNRANSSVWASFDVHTTDPMGQDQPPAVAFLNLLHLPYFHAFEPSLNLQHFLH